MNEKITDQKVLNATKWSTFAELMAKLATPIVNMVLARLLTPEVFGVIASITIITSFADIFTDAGFQRFIIQHDYQNADDLDKETNVAFWSNLILSIIIYLSIFSFRKSLAKFVGCPKEYIGISVAGLSVICTTFSSSATARFKRDMNFKSLFFVRIASSFLPFLVTIPLAIVLKSYWAIIVGTLSQQIVTAVLLTTISKWKPKFYFSFPTLKAMLPFSLWNLAETLSIWFAGQAGIFIVSNALSQYYVGLYKTSMSTVNSYMSLITASISSVLFSTLSRYKEDEYCFKKVVYSFIKGVSIIIVPMGVGMFLYRDLVVKILLGTQWCEAAFFVGLWALFSTMTITFSNIASEVYRSTGKPVISFILQLGFLLVYIPVIVWGAKQGYKTLCYVSCFIRILPVALDIIMMVVKYNISIHKMFIAVTPTMVSVAVMTALALFLKAFGDAVWWQFVSIVLCIVLYFTCTLIFKSNRELFRTLKLKQGEQQ